MVISIEHVVNVLKVDISWCQITITINSKVKGHLR